MNEREGLVNTRRWAANSISLGGIVVEACHAGVRLPGEEEIAVRVCCGGACQQGDCYSGEHDDSVD